VKDYRTFAEAGGNLERFIEGADNAKRFHSHPGYLPPNVFAEAMAPSAAFAYAVVRWRPVKCVKGVVWFRRNVESSKSWQRGGFRVGDDLCQ